MILTQTIKIKPNSKTIKHYRELGYECSIHSSIDVSVNHLTQGSHEKIKVSCDFCGKEKEIIFNSYWRNTNGLKDEYACSEKCGLKKRDVTNFQKYGVKNVFQNDVIKEKIKESYKKNLQVNHPSMNVEIQNKIKNTNKLKYGHTCAILNDDIKNKLQQTCLKKYGVTNSFQTIKSFNTKKKKIIDKYAHLGLIDIIDKKFILKCDKNHISHIEKSIFYNRLKLKTIICTECNPIGDYHRSGLEIEMSNFINENYHGSIILNKKFSYREVDVFLPEKKLAFEFNGLYWHNELNKSSNYHQEKVDFLKSLNIKLIHIFEDDWIYKQDIIKSRILNLLGYSKKMPARKCQIKEINDNNIIREFLEKNHIQGFVGSQIKIGLFHDTKLVSLMTFGSKRKIMSQNKIENTYEMLRFCNILNTTVVGGASKIFKYFLNKYNPTEIISYADKNWSSGNLYENLGFNFISHTKPNYYYVIDRKRYHRFNFRKDRLIKMGFDKNKTEHEIMLERKIYRIFDSGSMKYVFTLH